MQISTDKVVSFHYVLREEGGDDLEDSRDGDPVLYLHGHHGMLPALEKTLSGKSAGDSFDVTLTPEQAYGHRREDAVQRVARKHVITRGKLQPGMRVQLRTEHGAEGAVVLKVGLKTIDVDNNHPLAGKTLQFTIDIVEVRDASAEELAHGHGHGAGGHHH